MNAPRCTFGKGGNAQGVCRVWLCAIVPDRQTFVIIDRMVMRPASFLLAAELKVRGMELHGHDMHNMLLLSSRRRMAWATGFRTGRTK